MTHVDVGTTTDFSRLQLLHMSPCSSPASLSQQDKAMDAALGR